MAGPWEPGRALKSPDLYEIAYYEPREATDPRTFDVWLRMGKEGETLDELCLRAARPVRLLGPLPPGFYPLGWGTMAIEPYREFDLILEGQR